MAASSSTLTVSIGVLHDPEKRLGSVALLESSAQILLTAVKLAPGFSLITYLQTTHATESSSVGQGAVYSKAYRPLVTQHTVQRPMAASFKQRNLLLRLGWHCCNAACRTLEL
jgi:hypothetical protein